MGQDLVFVGGGHAHLTALKNLSDFIRSGHRVTLISPSPYHYYSGMGPGTLSGIYQPWEVRFHIQKMAEHAGARFVQGEVVRVDPRQRVLFLNSGQQLSYDVVSFNVGSEVPVDSLGPAAPGSMFPVKPVINLLKVRRHILDGIGQDKTFRFVVVGGGPAGVEISGNLWRLLDQNNGRGRITLIGGKRVLADGPEKLRNRVVNSLTARGIEIIEGSYAKEFQKDSVILGDGRKLSFDIALVAIGIRPSPLFKESGLPIGPDGGMLVNPQLQSTAHPGIFGGGDCVSLEGYSLRKVGVYAVRQNPILHHNLLAALNGGPMKDFKPQKEFLLIFNMGNGKGIFWKKNWIWEGRLAFLLKDYIDRKFMRTFQISGEAAERSEALDEHP